MPPFLVKWKLRAFLEREGVSAYAVAQKLAEASETPLHINTLYRWTNHTPSNPSLEGIGWVLWAVEELTGRRYSVADVLEYERAP